MIPPFQKERLDKRVFYGWIWLLSADKKWRAFWYRLLTMEMLSHDLRILQRKSKIVFWISISFAILGGLGILLSEYSLSMENIITTGFAWIIAILSGIIILVWYAMSLVVRLPISLWITLKTAKQAKNRVAIEKLKASKKVAYITPESLLAGSNIINIGKD